MSASRLRSILRPDSIAVIGASDDLAKVGARVVHLLRAGGYGGTIHPINPRRSEIQSLPCYPSVAAIGQPVDLCIIAVAAADVEAEARRSLEAGARGLIVLSSGFAEQDAEGVARQERLTALVREFDVPLIGPNCLGVMNGNIGLAASSTFAIRDRQLKAGALSFATQSGAIGTYWLDMCLAAGLGIANWVSSGNEAETGLAELLDDLVEDPQTRIIGLYIEGVRNGALFRRAAIRAWQARKPVLVLKSGRSAIGAAAAASHTGSLAGEDALYETFFEQFGMVRLQSLTEMVDLSRVLSMQPVHPGARTCVVSVSGGAGVLITDAAIDLGLTLTPPSAALASRLRELLPVFASPNNPLDITAQIATDPDLLGRVLKVLVASGEFDRMIIFCGGLGNLQQELADTMIEGVRGGSQPCVVIWQASRDLAVRMLTEAGLPVFSEITPAVRALAQSCRIAQHWERPLTTLHTPFLPDAEGVASTVALSEYASKALLKKDGVLPVPPGVLVHSPEEVAAAIAGQSGPFAIKLQSPDLLHKSGAGGIVLNVSGEADIRRTVTDMLTLARAQAWRCEGVLIETMMPIAFEFLVGLRRDPVLGAVLVLGRGGVSVEVDPDVTRAFLPLSEAHILSMLERLRCHRLLSGFRGQPPLPLDALAATVCGLTRRFESDPMLHEIEINPLVVTKAGSVVALDAAVWITTPA